MNVSMCNRKSYSFNNDDADGIKFCASLLNFRTLISHFTRSFTSVEISYMTLWGYYTP